MKNIVNILITGKTRIVFLAVILGLLLVPLQLFPQRKHIELSPFAGYQFGGSIKFIQGKFKIDNGLNYGGMLSVELRHATQLEFSYSRMDTRGDWTPYGSYAIDFPSNTVDVTVSYFQAGTVKEVILTNDQLRPFGLFSVGATWFQPKSENSQDEWLFSLAVGGGIKYFFSDHIGIRLQGRLLLPLIFNGAGFYFGFGTGGASSGVGVSSTAPLVQGDFTGGLVFVLGE